MTKYSIDEPATEAWPVPESVTRRQLLAVLPLLGLAAIGVSCGDDDEDDGESNGQRRTIQDAFGPVELPATPQRVIAVRHHHIGNMLAFGVTPVGMVPSANEFTLPGQAEALAGVANVRAEAEWMLDIEKALALSPDVILEMSGQEGDPWNQEICDLARVRVATACFPYSYDSAEGIKQGVRDVGEVLGLSARANELIAEYEKRIEDLSKRAREAGFADRKVANIIWTSFADSGFFVPVDRPSNVTLRSLGIPEPGFQSNPLAGDIPFSMETLSMLNEAWAVIVMVEGDAKGEDLAANPVWKLLDPVKANRVVFVDANTWGWDYLPAMQAMLDDVETKLLTLA